MLSSLERNPETSVRRAIDTPEEHEDVVSVCDRLLTSLEHAEQNGRSILIYIEEIKGMGAGSSE